MLLLAAACLRWDAVYVGSVPEGVGPLRGAPKTRCAMQEPGVMASVTSCSYPRYGGRATRAVCLVLDVLAPPHVGSDE